MAEVFIMRGLPGAGKSTWTRRNHPGARVFSADGFFTDGDGTYRFDGQLLPDAHAACLRGFAGLLLSLDRGIERPPSVIVVDNTAIRAWEIAPYYSLGRAYGHDVCIVQVDCDVLTAHSRNIHGVPLERIEQMDEDLRGEELPSFWNVLVVKDRECPV